MSNEPLILTLTDPLAEKVRAAAEACGLSPDEWAAMVLRRRMAADRDAKDAKEKDAAD